MKYADIVHRCFRCGYCKFTSDYTDFNCPAYYKFRFETYSPGGRMWLIRAWLNNEIKNSERFQEILFSCATCANCVEHCVFTFSDDLVNIFIAAREELVAEGIIPPAVRDYLKNIHVNGNPYKAPAAERGKWAKGTAVEAYRGQDYLFYVGCVGSYDERAVKIARAVGTLLVEAGLSIGILGEKETCDGNEVRALGESGLFEQLAEQNILAPLIQGDKIPLKESSLKVTYHDPCYLGRHNHEYQAPRSILKAIPGLELVEMERHGENAFCCGGGGGNFFTDILGGGEESPARLRVREALDTGAGIIAVACPQCAKMLEDAVKSEELEDRLKVMDVAEIVSGCLGD